jgi:uncharacterized membrane protein YsdA (DUF1294 family)
VGDQIQFVLGWDRQGRTCATEATHMNDGGRLGIGHFLVLVALLVAPGLAVYRKFGPIGAAYVGGWATALSLLTYFFYALDKRRAQENARREPEKLLHLMELVGGWPGAFLAQYQFRHKVRKVGYQVVFFLIVGVYQFIAVDALRGWPILKSLFN